MDSDHDLSQFTPGETLSLQRDLDGLCAERALETRELFAPNAYYGNDLALKAYCGWPADRPLKVIIPHGVVFNRDYLWGAEVRASLPVVLAYPDYRIPAYRAGSRKLIVAGAAPFVFVCRMMQRVPVPQRAGTLFFPAHSTHGVNAETDHHAIAARLSRLDQKYLPVRICIYWKDFLAGRHLPYADRGFEILSAGHMFDPAFMFRLYHLLSMHRFAASTTEGSYIFYAVQAGCIYFHLPGFDTRLQPRTEANRTEFCAHPEAEAVLPAFLTETGEVSSKQAQIVETFMGARNIASPAALRKIFATAEALDRYGLARVPNGAGIHWNAPAALPRWISGVVRRVFAGRGGLPGDGAHGVRGGRPR